MTTAPVDPAEDFQRRVAAVEARLRDLSRRRLDGLTAPDPVTGERWECDQVWAHMGEFIPYWIAEAERVLAAEAPGPVPFGRTQSNPERLAAIERDRRRGAVTLWHDVREDLNDLRAFLRGVSGRGWQVRGLHPVRGAMSVAQIVEAFLVGHVEEHTAQLETLRHG